MDNIIKLILVIALFLIIPRWMWRKRPKLKLAILNLKEDVDSESLKNNFNEAIKICNNLYKSSLEESPDIVRLNENDIFDYHYLYIEVSDSFNLSSEEIKELNEYIEGGGFIHFNVINTNQLDLIKASFSEYDWEKIQEPEFSYCWKKVIKDKNINFSDSSFYVEGIKIEERWRVFLTDSTQKSDNDFFPCLLACYIIAALK